MRKSFVKNLTFSGDEGLLTDYFKVAVCSEPPINSSNVVIKREALIAVGGFPEGITSGEDILTWARLASRYQIAYSLKPLSVFTINNNVGARVPQAPDIVAHELWEMVHSLNPLYLSLYISFWHRMRAKSYLKLGQKRNALAEICLSIRVDPSTRAWCFLPFVFLSPRIFKLATKQYSKHSNG
jgi:hypothetical protein